MSLDSFKEQESCRYSSVVVREVLTDSPVEEIYLRENESNVKRENYWRGCTENGSRPCQCYEHADGSLKVS